MRKTLTSLALVAALVVATVYGAAQKMTCRETGKTVAKCCCEMKGGKFYCTLTKKTYDQCCCDMK